MSDKKEISDEELVVKIRTNDKQLFREIVERYEKSLMRYALFLVKNRDKAEDIVQQSFIKAYINLNGFNTGKKFSSWIYRIVHNEAMNMLKKYKKETPIIEGLDFAASGDIEEDFLKRELAGKAHSCLRELPIIYSEPLALQYLEEKSYAEISDILHLPIGTVAVRIKRAKVVMKKLCKELK